MIRIVVLALLAFFALAPGAHAQANADYDQRNGVTLFDAPYRSAATFTTTPPVTFNNQSFTEAEEYAAGPSRFAACAGNGSKSGWVRFNTDVDGQLYINVDSSQTPFDVFYKIYTAPNTIAPGTAAIGQMEDLPGGCVNNVHGGPNEQYSFGHEVPRGNVVYVQVMSVCANREGIFPCDANERVNAPGGPISLTVTFDPKDTDGDNVADGVDACQDQSGSATATPVGCPDSDGDNKADAIDECDSVPGSAPDGCRVADEDGDGFDSDDPPFGGRDCNDDEPAQNPGAPEVPYNDVDENCDGHDFRDRDGDNYDDDKRSEDCRPGNPKINAGEREVPGNQVDEDCKNGPKPFKRLKNQITPTFTDRDGNGKADGIARIVVYSAFKGLRITVTCARGECPYGKKTRVAKKRGNVTVAKDFRKRLAPGTRVTVHLQARRRVGKALQYTFTRGATVPKSTARCSEAGSNKLLKESRCDGLS